MHGDAPQAAFPFLFVGMWVGISHVLSHVGGWSRLARVYRAGSDTDGRSWNLRSAMIGMVSYGHCLRFTARSNGLRIAVHLPFRVGHAPLFIPWSELSVTQHRGWLFRYADLRFRQQPSVRVRIFWSLAEQLATHSEGHFKLGPGTT